MAKSEHEQRIEQLLKNIDEQEQKELFESGQNRFDDEPDYERFGEQVEDYHDAIQDEDNDEPSGKHQMDNKVKIRVVSADN